MKKYVYRSAIGQDSHRFIDSSADVQAGRTEDKPLILGGVLLEGYPGLKANSDGDVFLHALTNAVSGITGVNILGERADKLCKEEGISDSSAYLKLALSYLGPWRITSASFSFEGKRPVLAPYIPAIKSKTAELLGLSVEDIGLTATSGEALTDFGKGLGVQVFCIVNAVKEVKG